MLLVLGVVKLGTSTLVAVVILWLTLDLPAQILNPSRFPPPTKPPVMNPITVVPNTYHERTVPSAKQIQSGELGTNQTPVSVANSGPATNTARKAVSLMEPHPPRTLTVGMDKAHVLKVTRLDEAKITKNIPDIPNEALEIWILWKTADDWSAVQTDAGQQVIVRFQNGKVAMVVPPL